MSRFRWYGPTLVLLLTVVVVMFAAPGMIRSLAWAKTDAQIRTIRNDLAANPSLVELSEAFKQVAIAVEPSVVHIEVQSRGNPMASRNQRSPRNPFDEFFEQIPDLDRLPAPLREELERRQQQSERAPRGQNYDDFDTYRPVGNGSGWVYRHNTQNGSTQDYILTNAHVVEMVGDTERIRVSFHDRREVYAEIVGEPDKQTDVAVLKVKGDGSLLHPAALAGAPVQQGEIVFAFGSPFGSAFSFSMSQGIVSAVGRQVGIMGRDGYEDFIQTDAAINPGNSGGPLVNTRGQVVGMNTAIASRDGGFNGLGFAIPVGMAADIADRIITDGSVRRGFMGIEIADLAPEWAAAFGYDGKGVLVQDVIPGGAADAAGVLPGDIIISVDGRATEDVRTLRYRVADLPPGRAVDVKVFRDGEEQALEVTLGERGGILAARTSRDAAPPDGGDDGEVAENERLIEYGLTGLETFTERAAEQLGFDFEPAVLVTGVRRGSVAQGIDAGIAERALITAVYDTPVTNLAELVEAVNALDADRPLRLTIKNWDLAQERYRQRFALLVLPNE